MNPESQKAVDTLFENNSFSNSFLVLDTTGLALSLHFHVLVNFNKEQLFDVKEIHGYSGGTYAYCIYLARLENKWKYPIKEYLDNFDKKFRKAHNKNPFQIVKTANRLVRGLSAYEDTNPIRIVLNYIFDKEFLSRPASSLPENFRPFVGCKNTETCIDLRAEYPEYYSNLTIEDLILISSDVPKVYGGNTSEHQLIDAAFDKGYKNKIRSYSKMDLPVFLVTPWRNGQRKNVTFINPYTGKDYKKKMMIDFAKLLSNLPNSSYNSDLKTSLGNKQDYV